uniref:Putative restriction endonuclease n=1 Tax=Candidatus Criblamydia sequanensis CRIB-18 TaxID=1437425 RepID=A0A090D134_9BACT|nr:ATP cone domain-containing protein [Criblamydia sequanensis]CDR35278.1 putative restriction endonuclease [Criblamydia sequanensis CRIB-18]
MKIIKANGEETSYEPDKIVRSLERAGANQKIIQEVLSETEKELFDGIHTKAVYKIVFRNLKRLSHQTAGKYHLKNAIMELGPTGFPFENFIAALFEAEGYQTLTDQIVQGHCVQHEVDVVSEKDNNHFMMECKFHGTSGNICDVKHALYVHARFLDVEKTWLNKPGHAQKFHQGWLVTNTRLSGDAERYGKCVGMGLLSWNYPQGDSLRERIDRNGLYPITCLTSLSKHEKQILLNKKVVLCRTLCEHPSELNGIGLSETKKLKVLEEGKLICKNKYRDL